MGTRPFATDINVFSLKYVEMIELAVDFIVELNYKE
jgi:hypothetical protein